MQKTSRTGVRIPRGVFCRHGALYLVRREQGRQRWIYLCPDGSASELAAALLRIEPTAAPRSIGDLLLAYVRSGMNELVPKTRREYQRMAQGRLMHYFGQMLPGAVKTAHVARYLQMRLDDGAGAMGNRERAVLSSAHEFGMRRGYVPSNPCRGVRRNKERPSKVRVSDSELVDLIDGAPEYWQPFFQALYLLGWRVMDVAGLSRTALGRDGIRIVESKNQVEHFKEWSPTLRSVIAAAIAHGDAEAKRRRAPKPAAVFTGRYGQPLTYWAIASQMARMGRPFELRQVRAKAETDAPGTLGHKGQMARRYTRSVRTRPVK